VCHIFGKFSKCHGDTHDGGNSGNGHLGVLVKAISKFSEKRSLAAQIGVHLFLGFAHFLGHPLVLLEFGGMFLRSTGGGFEFLLQLLLNGNQLIVRMSGKIIENFFSLL
jgi:hypothetical protein